MPNGTEDLTDEELGQDYREPDVPPVTTEPPTVTPPPAPAVAPPAPTVAPPGARIPQSAMVGSIMSRLATQMQGQQLPLDEAQRAVSAALKFQAIRGYQNDLNSGVSPADALAKWAPMMFTTQGAGTLGQAAQLIHYARPTVQRPIDVGGVAYSWEPATGTMRPLTPPKAVAPPRANTLDVEEYRSNLRDISALQKELDAEPSGTEADDKRNKIRYLTGRNREIYRKSQGPAVAAPGGVGAPVRAPGPAAPAAAPAAPTPRVTSKADYDRLPKGTIYVGKDGRKYRKP